MDPREEIHLIFRSIVFYAFCLFILVLPFFKISVIGTYSVDNLLAPLLLGFWILTFIFRVAPPLTKRHVAYFFLIGLYLLMSLLSDLVVFNARSLKIEIISHLKYLLYFILPMICIPSLQRFEGACKLMVLAIAIICWAAVLESLGIISLDFLPIADRAGDAGRFYSSRFGELPRSAGLAGEFGTLAVLTSFTISALFLIGNTGLKRSKWNVEVFWKICVVITLLVAIIIAQSRNVFLAGILTIGIIGFLKIFLKDIDVKKIFIAYILFVVIIVGCVVFVANFQDINAFIVGKYGMRQNIYTRFNQYNWATALISENIILGIDGTLKIRYVNEIISLHNFWLNQMLRFGLLGTLPLALIFLKFSKGIIGYVGQPQANSMAICMLGLSIAFMVAGMFYAAQSSVYYWFVAGFIMAFDTTAYREIYAKDLDTSMYIHPQYKFRGNAAH